MSRNKFRAIMTWGVFIVIVTLVVTTEIKYRSYCTVDGIREILEKEIGEALENGEQLMKRKPNEMALAEYARKSQIDNFIIAKGDTIKYWTSIDIIISDSALVALNESEKKIQGISTPNRIYTARKYIINPDENINCYHLISIKNDYTNTNKYLVNRFIINPDISSSVHIEIKKEKRTSVPINLGASTLFYIYSKEIAPSKYQSRVIFFLYLFLIISFSLTLWPQIKRSKWIAKICHGRQSLLYICTVFSILFILFYFEQPAFLLKTYFFDGLYFILPTKNIQFGHYYIFFTVVLLFASQIFFKEVCFNVKNRTVKKIIALICFALSTALQFIPYFSIHIIVFDSFNIIQLSEPGMLSVDSIILLLFICIQILGIVIIQSKAVELINDSFESRLVKNTLFIASMVILTLITIIYNPLFCVYIIQLGTIIYFQYIRKTKSKLYYLLMVTLVTSASYSIIIEKFYLTKAEKQLEVQTSSLLNNRDKILELRFLEEITNFQNDIKTDNSPLNKILVDGTEEDVNKFIIDNYLYPFRDHYQITITQCTESTLILINDALKPCNCIEYFETIISSIGIKTITDYLYFMGNGNEIRSYIGVFELSDSEVLYVDLYENNSFLIQGYPELLKPESTLSLINKSLNYGIYFDNELVNLYGEMSFPIHYNPSIIYNNHLLNIKEFSNNRMKIIVASKNYYLLEALAGTPYIFIFSTLLLILFYIFAHQEIGFNMMSRFKYRLQLSIFSIIFVSLVAIGSFTYLHLLDRSEMANISSLKELSNTILLELESKFSYINKMTDEDIDDLNNQLMRYSNFFYTDINVFNTAGYMIGSSRTQITEKNIISNRIDNKAFEKIGTSNMNMYIMYQQIGEYKFLSSYFPLRNYNNEIIAFVNLPYFTKQEQMTEEVSRFITTFVNIYIFITILSLLMIWIVSNYITKPLARIKESMFKTKLSEKNIKIKIERNDEIGELIKSYNNMIDELEKSALQLAANERDTAWREMAKQVAHEIKNPLTPMKLNIQHFNRVFNTEDEEARKKLNSFTQTLIQQIDSLSEIASAFSDFAKMPKASPTLVDLKTIITEVVNLYESEENVTFTVNTEKKYLIQADKKQIQRIFINMINNALYAMENVSNGEILISISDENNNININVCDNGNGIPEDKIGRIFTPNFTTKTSGSGLGLGIVKRIVESYNGTITLVTTSEKGTIFRITFPLEDQQLS